MAHFKLIAKQGIDPSDGIETYLAVLHDDTGAAVAAGAWNVTPNNASLFDAPQSFLIALSLGLTDLRKIDDKGQALIDAASDWAVLWEGETEGDIEEYPASLGNVFDDVETEGGEQ